MATAYKCDRCGNLFETKKERNLILTEYLKGGRTHRVDLCADCQKSLELWLKESEK